MVTRFLITILSGLVIGAIIALGLVFGPTELGGIRVGSWYTNRHIGSVEASPLIRAIIARRGLLALRQSETIYFSADHDSSGVRFDAACSYRIVFEEAPQARWWSVTLYAEDEYLAVNGDAVHSVSADHATSFSTDGPFPEGGFEAIIANSQTRSPAVWISSANSGAFNLTLRMYHPDEGVIMDAATAHLPQIELLSCEGEA